MIANSKSSQTRTTSWKVNDMKNNTHYAWEKYKENNTDQTTTNKEDWKSTTTKQNSNTVEELRHYKIHDKKIYIDTTKRSWDYPFTYISH